ncbi:MAG: cyclic pyranopterin monophosphate synthase MoaC [Deltaproteobacteria bacterium]
MAELTHLDDKGRARMVDVSDKDISRRRAVAEGVVLMDETTLERIDCGGMAKGDVLAVARTAGIMAAKRTDTLIPLCHPLPLDAVEVVFERQAEGRLLIRATVGVTARTGAEMEALVAVSVAALTVYDMCKSVDRGMTVASVGLVEKSGGRSGDWTRK